MEYTSFSHDHNKALKFWSNVLGGAILDKDRNLQLARDKEDKTYIIMANMNDSTIENAKIRLARIYWELGI